MEARDHSRKFDHRDRAAEQVPLHLVTSERSEAHRLLFRLDPFGNSDEAER